MLLARIKTVHLSSRQTYGAPRVHAELCAAGERHGRKRIARLMRAAGLVSASRRQGGPITTQRDKQARPTPGLVNRDFQADGPNRLWLADITCPPTAAGFLYLAVVVDVWSRSVVGWAMANPLRAELVLDALNMALGQRRPREVIHHPDQSLPRRRPGAANIPRSRSASAARKPACSPQWARSGMPEPVLGLAKPDPGDSALCESFLATLECELLERRRFTSHLEACMACFSFIEGFSNPTRRHSALGYRSSFRYKQEMQTDRQSATP